MRSTIVIASELDKLRELLTQKTEHLVKDSDLKKRLRDISGFIGAIGIFNGLESSKKIISDNLSSTKKSIDALKEEPFIKSTEEINQVLNMIDIAVTEYGESLKQTGDTPESLRDKCNKINQDFKIFKYTNHSSAGMFSGSEKSTSPHTKVRNPDFGKDVGSNGNSNHSKSVAVSPPPSTSPTKKAS